MMKDGDQSSVYLDSNFKPPDRSTSAPPVLSLQSESLFAFRAAEHLQLFSDIRSYEDDDHLLQLQNPANPHSSHQQQIQQLQQQIQQQQQQIQQQQALQQHLQLQQQQYMQQQQQSQSPHHSSHPQHLQMQHPPLPNPPPHHPQQQHQHLQQQLHPQQIHPQQMQQQQQQQQQFHPQQHPQQMHQQHPHQFPNNHLAHYQQQQPQQHQQQQLHPQQHMRGYSDVPSVHQGRPSLPDIRNPLPRSTSNPSYNSRATHSNFEPVPEDPSHGDEDAEAIWTPLPRRSVPNLGEYEDAPHPMQQLKGQGRGHPSHPSHNAQQPYSQQAPHPQTRDPNLYYQQPDYDNVAFSTASSLLKEDNLQSIWNDRAFDTRQQQQRDKHVAAPTPNSIQSQSQIMDLLGNNFGNNIFAHEAPTADKILSRNRRASSGGRNTMPAPPTTSPPLIQHMGSGSASTSPALPICRYFAQGFCSRGDRCNFIHDEQSQQQGLNSLSQDNAPISVPKPKAKKTVASPPPMQMNLPPKVPSPVNQSLRLGPAHVGNGLHHSSNGLPNSGPNGLPSSNSSSSPNNTSPNQASRDATLSSILSSLSTMNLERSGPSGRTLSPSLIAGDLNGSSSPQPRSTTPNGSELDFSNGSGSPNSKSDLTRQYTSIEQVIGHIYSLCKDQHGCRFLQKKLEDRDPMIVEIIFNEVYDHMTELMIDPFGNYLCQKLLEHCNDEQRLEIIEKVAPDLVKISKNMHGTRAVQKMIEYLTTPEQIAIAKKALSNHVVTLIQDLNGNHVIQRCLNRLSPQDNQFIYDSVSQAGHCVEVATHRHGCCVLQRCIDHASDSQKIQLINEIIANALVLVQDPYGNYVVQYVLDLPFPGLASRLARRFLGHIPILSTQKFSSNVVEKCLNVTDIQTRAATIQELVEYDNLLYLLQDPYANYVIQTSLNVSEPVQHARLVEAIRPHLTSLRNTPYGKRIQNKILKESSRDYYA